MTLSKIKSVLVITQNRLGDTLFCTPLIRLLKTTLPHVQTDILASTALASEVFANNPYINKILLMPEIEFLAEQKDKYDLVIKVGASEYADKCWNVFNAEKIDVSNLYRHGIPAAESYLQYFAQRFAINLEGFPRHYDLFPVLGNHENIKKLIGQKLGDLESFILVGFHLGCHGLAKKRNKFWRRNKHQKAWPVEKFIKLGKLLMEANPRVRIVVTGSKEEEAIGKIFSRKIPQTINLINQTSVHDVAALMKYLKVFLANDTGVMHVACTTDVNLIVLGGPSDLSITGPYPKEANRIILQKAKINDITVEEVLLTTSQFLTADHAIDA